VETLSVPPVQLRRVAGRPAIVRRGRVVPLVSLAEVAGFSAGDVRSGPLDLLVIGVGGQALGLVVDEIGQHCQVVVKPLDAALLTPGVDGAAVLADGRVALVVDPVALLASTV
jgi:chemotaxis protein histidine kinase CheA